MEKMLDGVEVEWKSLSKVGIDSPVTNFIGISQSAFGNHATNSHPVELAVLGAQASYSIPNPDEPEPNKFLHAIMLGNYSMEVVSCYSPKDIAIRSQA
jgi:hypothetical protein